MKGILFGTIVLTMFCYLSSCGTDSDTDCSTPLTIEIGPNSMELIPSDLSDRGDCSEVLGFTPEVTITESGSNRVITSNAIPDHKVGLFGNQSGALNPNAIGEVSSEYSVSLNPTQNNEVTPLLSTSSGPQYEFGVLLNGCLLDPEAAEPWPHSGSLFGSGTNWEWNLDAMIINLGMDCNNAHVQPSGKYHYHGPPTLYLESLNIGTDKMTLIGYAADGFPIYYKYAYSMADDPGSDIVEMQSSYQLKSGERPGDGDSAPCGDYNGVYTNDWEYVDGLGELDECNGRFGKTDDYPDGTYYYVITDSFPFIPRCLRGTPSNDFKI